MKTPKVAPSRLRNVLITCCSSFIRNHKNQLVTKQLFKASTIGIGVPTLSANGMSDRVSIWWDCVLNLELELDGTDCGNQWLTTW
jgi:hypothetical protein